jgi:dihydrofolate reductase
MTVTAILHTDLNGLLGINGQLAYKSREDFREFQKITRIPKSVLVVGKKTAREMGKITDRDLLVLSRKGYRFNNKPTDKTVESLIADNRNVFICGGSSVYSKYIPLCSKVIVHLTHQTKVSITSTDICNYFNFNLLEDFYCTEAITFNDFTQLVFWSNS